MLSLVAALKPLVEQIGVLDSRIAHAVRSHPDGEVFLSLFRNPGSTLTAAKLLSEIGDRRERRGAGRRCGDVPRGEGVGKAQGSHFP